MLIFIFISLVTVKFCVRQAALAFCSPVALLFRFPGKWVCILFYFLNFTLQFCVRQVAIDILFVTVQFCVRQVAIHIRFVTVQFCVRQVAIDILFVTVQFCIRQVAIYILYVTVQFCVRQVAIYILLYYHNTVNCPCSITVCIKIIQIINTHFISLCKYLINFLTLLLVIIQFAFFSKFLFLITL